MSCVASEKNMNEIACNNTLDVQNMNVKVEPSWY